MDKSVFCYVVVAKIQRNVLFLNFYLHGSKKSSTFASAFEKEPCIGLV